MKLHFEPSTQPHSAGDIDIISTSDKKRVGFYNLSQETTADFIKGTMSQKRVGSLVWLEPKYKVEKIPEAQCHTHMSARQYVVCRIEERFGNEPDKKTK